VFAEVKRLTDQTGLLKPDARTKARADLTPLSISVAGAPDRESETPRVARAAMTGRPRVPRMGEVGEPSPSNR